MLLYVFFFFFFQAEDGIRDAQESRGLGDVYKRQIPCLNEHPRWIAALSDLAWRNLAGWLTPPPEPKAVSYTHLTLPTIYSV